MSRALAILCFALAAFAGEPGTVVIGELEPERAINIGIQGGGSFRRKDDARDFRSWLSVASDRGGGEALLEACVRRLRSAQPPVSVLASPVRHGRATAGLPWELAIGSEVPAVVVRQVGAALREAGLVGLRLRAGNDEAGIISLGPATPGTRTVDAVTLGRLADRGLDAASLAILLAEWGPSRADPPARTGGVEVVLDLDLRTGPATTRPPGLSWEGVTWTADGVLLPGRVPTPLPQGYPQDREDLPLRPMPYGASLLVPDIARGDRACAITLQVCLGTPTIGLDHLVTVGRRSRWLSAHLDPQGRVVPGLDNRWRLAPEGIGPGIADGRWHVVTVGVAGDGETVRVVVDGLVADVRLAHHARTAPRRIDSDAEDELSFVDPGSGRHCCGAVRRLLVHRGLPDPATLAALHARWRSEAPQVPTLPQPQPEAALPAEEPPRAPASLLPPGSSEF